MGTSGSHEWTATAHVYSGRPDPEWEVDADVAELLMDLWAELPTVDEVSAVPPALGYRGVTLSGPRASRWTAYGGRLVMSADETQIVRLDVGRAWERRLLDSAPSGLLPPIEFRKSSG